MKPRCGQTINLSKNLRSVRSWAGQDSTSGASCRQLAADSLGNITGWESQQRFRHLSLSYPLQDRKRDAGLPKMQDAWRHKMITETRM